MSAKGVGILCLLCLSQFTNSEEETEANILDTTSPDTNSPQPDIIYLNTEDDMYKDEETNNHPTEMVTETEILDTENNINEDEETNDNVIEFVTEMETAPDILDTENDINKDEEISNNVTEIVTAEKMEGKIVGGALTSLDTNPHVAYLAISCKMSKDTKRFGCGSSILNHQVLITAAHCLHLCSSKSIIAIATASENKFQGLNNTGKDFLIHPKFVPKALACDIALVKVRHELILGPRIKRVILMRKPPHIETAYLAGWGLIDEKEKIGSTYLKLTTQQIISKKECKRILKNTPTGTICAKATRKYKKLYGYAAKGDSGSGLIGEDYILRGVVSHKHPKIAAALIVYTDTAFYYDWIWQSTKQLMCTT